MSYYNTTRVRDRQLAEYEGKASKQKDQIYQLFLHNRGVPFSPSQVRKSLGMYQTPITSVRRAMTDLTTEGRLMKTALQVKGPYGRPEYCWRLAGPQRGPQRELF